MSISHVRLVVFSVLSSLLLALLVQPAVAQAEEVKLGLSNNLSLGVLVINVKTGQSQFVDGLFGSMPGSDGDPISNYDEQDDVTQVLPLLLVATTYRITKNFSTYLDLQGAPYVGMRYDSESLGRFDLGVDFFGFIGDDLGSKVYKNPYALDTTGDTNKDRPLARLAEGGLRFIYGIGPASFTVTYRQHKFVKEEDDQTKELTETNTGAPISEDTFGRAGIVMGYEFNIGLFGVSVGLGYEKADLEGKADSYTKPSISLGHSFTLSKQVGLNVSLGGGIATYDQENPFFDETRKDSSFDLSLVTMYGAWSIILSASQSDSNIDFFDEKTALVGFAYRFDLKDKAPYEVIYDSVIDAF